MKSKSSVSRGDEYADDEAHAIPRVHVIDVETKIKGGGAYYGIVIASPLRGDQRSQNRLLQKIQHYIDDFYSPKFIAVFGRPVPHKCRIYVTVHPDSDSVIFDLLERCRTWVEENNIMYVIEADLKSHHVH